MDANECHRPLRDGNGMATAMTTPDQIKGDLRARAPRASTRTKPWEIRHDVGRWLCSSSSATAVVFSGPTPKDPWEGRAAGRGGGGACGKVCAVTWQSLCGDVVEFQPRVPVYVLRSGAFG